MCLHRAPAPRPKNWTPTGTPTSTTDTDNDKGHHLEECLFGAACLGVFNAELLGKFIDGDRESPDPALLNHNESCNTAYRNDSFLCGSCAPKFSHTPGDLSGKCGT